MFAMTSRRKKQGTYTNASGKQGPTHNCLPNTNCFPNTDSKKTGPGNILQCVFGSWAHGAAFERYCNVNTMVIHGDGVIGTRNHIPRVATAHYWKIHVAKTSQIVQNPLFQK